MANDFFILITTMTHSEIHRRIMDTVSNIAVRCELPYQVHVLVQEPETGKRYGSFVAVEYLGERPGMARITRTGIGELREGSTPMDIADLLLEHNPGTPLVCDEQIAQELSKNSLCWVNGDGYRLQGRQNGVLEVYIPHKSKKVSGLPEEFHAQLFEG